MQTFRVRLLLVVVSGLRNHMTYRANGVAKIECLDKKGHKVTFPNSPRVEMRITAKPHKTFNFYFDTVNLQDSVFTGCNSRILNTHRSVHFSDIKKVRIQRGAKAYNYTM